MAAPAFPEVVQTPSFRDAGHGFDVFGMHPPFVARVLQATRLLYERYFRVESRGAAHIPAHGAALLVANHGGVLPLDAAVLCLDVLRRSNPPRIPRPVAERFVPRLPLVSTLLARCGVVSGTRANVRRLVEQGELLAIFPEGVRGTAKTLRERYQLQRWSVGFAELALRHDVPVVPVGIVGAEESWPVAFKLPALRPFGAPYFPVPVSPLPLPARIHVRYGAPLRLAALVGPGSADDPARVAAAAGHVQEAVVALIREARAERAGVFR